ncbi:MAG: hypothetical protein JWN96_336 [Mycobacterium sp.]|nr:hypothetical protein [Mycobacterium sp.]
MDDQPTTPRAVARGTCARCGDPLPIRSRSATPAGHPCGSQRCRRAAYEERRAAANGAIGIELVRTPPVEKEHDLTVCAHRASQSPAACRRILLAPAALARDGELRNDSKWESTITALGSLNDALHRPPAYRSRWVH